MTFILVISVIIKHKQALSMQIEDRNGDDNKELCIITDEMIKQYIDNYNIIRHSITKKGNSSSGVTGDFEDMDRPYVKVETGMLSGIYVSNVYLGNGSDVTYTIDSKVTSGNLRIIITDESCNVLYEIPIDSKETITFFAEESKTYYVKFVGESAKIDVEVTRETAK